MYLLAKREPPTRLNTNELGVWFLDVGQGDCSLIADHDHAILIDGGEYDNGFLIAEALKKRGITHLDAVINSHPHSDHLGGLPTVLEQIPTDAVYLPDYPASLTPTGYTFERFLDVAEAQNLRISVPNCGDTLTFGGFSLTFFSIDNAAWEDLNDCSLVCRIAHGNNSFLFTGDITENAENVMLAKNLIQPATVLKTAHHGSGNSSSEAFLDAVQPEYAVISVGSFNDYGHPSAHCLERLFARTGDVFRTDVDGTTAFFSDGESLTVETHITF